MSHRLADYDYDLPEELIAAYPAERRDGSRLLVLDRGTGGIEHRRFADFPRLLRAGDLLVLNDTRVVPARLEGRRPGGGRIELLLLRPQPDGAWCCLTNPSRRLRTGLEIELPGKWRASYLGRGGEEGEHLFRLDGAGELRALLESHGHVPLPPYILRRRGRGDEPIDRERYQTVYAREDGAVAAPTAGLHFTDEVLRRIEAAGVEIQRITLSVGPGTFLPVRVEDIREHRMQAEEYEIAEAAAAALNRASAEGRRVVAVGTTVVRALESAWAEGRVVAGAGRTELFLYPGCELHLVGALLTNFHLPRSTLLMLVAALAGRERVLAAYDEAVRAGYRFYSYGDATFIA